MNVQLIDRLNTLILSDNTGRSIRLLWDDNFRVVAVADKPGTWLTLEKEDDTKSFDSVWSLAFSLFEVTDVEKKQEA